MVILIDHDSSTTSNTAREYDVYDVFLSFRGLDTRHGFTYHLNQNLKAAGILTFLDDGELERGEPLKQQLESAIKQSSISIIVFSQNYATSHWCLNEVERILEQKKIRGESGDHYKVIPIFYHVDPSDVRYQKGSYEEAFKRHRKKRRVSLEKIKAWKAALTEAANLVGLALFTHDYESEEKFIGKILSEVIRSLPNRKILDVPELLLGIDYRANSIDSWFKSGSKDDNVLVICGIGGIGKTTIAKHLFNEYFRDFDASCFLARITAMWDQNEACGLQSQLLSSILNKQRKETTIDNCDEGTQKIKRALSNKKVILLLDDVSETKQIDALLGQRQQFCPGSKILVTTRNELLAKHFIVPPRVHRVGCLKEKDSLELFSWHAFHQYHPPEAYKQLSKEILLRCEGLPLALIVLASSLHVKLDVVFWEQQLKKWDEIVNSDIHKIMKISYDTLEDNTVKNLFLHVACFFVGEEKDYIVKILDRRGMHAAVGIQSLTDRCLITIDDKKLMMHRVIQDMGREIVRQESPDEPGKRSRLWCHEDSFTVLKYDKGTEAVQGLILDGKKVNKVESDGSSFEPTDANPRSISKIFGYVKKKKEELLDIFLPSKEGDLKLEVFAKMVNLELVKLNHVHLTGSCNKFPQNLRWISWHGFPQEYVPMELPLQNLIAFDLQHSILKQVWKGYKEVKSLKFLNLSYSLDLYQTPDFRGLKQLERLILRGCSKLVMVCNTIGILQKLVLLDLRDCKSLRDLPALPESIKTIELSGCDLGEFPRERQNVEPFLWERIVKFASPSIAMGPVKLLADLPHLLVSLYLMDCNLSDDCFPRDFGGLSSLEGMNLSGNLITRLPDCVRNLSNSRLRWLTISKCPQLQSVINPPSTLKYMNITGNRQLERTKTRQNSRESYLEVDGHAEYIEVEGCIKVAQGWNVDRKVIKNLGLESLSLDFSKDKVVYEFGIFSTFVEGRSEFPSCFTTYPITYNIEESEDGEEELYRTSILYTIPSSANKIQGLNICFALRIERIDGSRGEIVIVDITVFNKTKDCAWTYKSERFLQPKVFCPGRVPYVSAEEYLRVSTWKCVDVLEAGDNVEISFKFLDISHKVKECGVRMVYEEDLEDNITGASTSLEDHETTDRLLWTDQMNVSFSNYLTPGTSYFFLGRPTSFDWRDTITGETIDGREVKFVDWSGVEDNWASGESSHTLDLI